MVLVADELDHLVALALVVGLDVVVVDEPLSDVRVPPRGKGGRLGAGVVVDEKLLVLIRLKVGRLREGRFGGWMENRGTNGDEQPLEEG